MGKKRVQSARRKKKPSNRDSMESSEPNNFVLDAGQGCHICHYDAPWILGIEPFDREDYEDDAEFPDVAICPDSPHVVSVINADSKPRTFYLTLYHQCLDARGNLLQMGFTRDEKGDTEEVITFILVVAANTLMNVCRLADDCVDLEAVHRSMDSDVQELQLHPSAEHHSSAHAYPFPLEGEGPFLCTQGINGGLTHFFAGSYHAVDFRCPVGTPLLAIGNGEVVEVRQDQSVSGIHVRNLFLWNSIMLALDDGTFVEYVHIRKGSATVNVGDRIATGQVVCESGDVGFSPEPHLHMQMHVSREVDAPTLKFALLAMDPSKEESIQTPYFPVAGSYYNSRGIAEAPFVD